MRVRIIPEDYPNDHLILRLIFGAMFAYLAKPRARIDVHCPEIKSLEAVKKLDHIRQIITDFPETQIFLLCVDRDGDPHRRKALDDLEVRVQRTLPRSRLFLAEHAWQEVEVWGLAGIDWRLKPRWSWEGIRSERDSKEHYFEPIAKARGLFDLPGQGREILGPEAARNYAKVRQNCPEVRNLEDRIRQWVAATSQR
jgi:hypothetical protein